MAMSGGRDDGAPMMEMNTTPLIDVMLVLLIMFIITIPVQTHAVKIDLPVDSSNPPPLVDPVVNKVIITPDDVIQWNGQPITLQQFDQLLQESRQMTPEPELQFQPSATTRYVIVDEALASIKRSGITKFGFVGNEQFRQFGKAAVMPK
ncbi:MULTISPECIES: ExbD/TolR family protein [Novosphingopyxis]|uniref:ExbD/TolR family protein n=1 Tax=Novosphingopyxis TaxID=2709686 RepID=UPI000C4FFFA4|nr:MULTISPECIES: biopolymer transporter ExbD [Novosphingopyxis]MAB90788.1 biopolymer transporter ExbD [Planctomycetota bacterium]MAC11489.1 biopolymer transporter ExbD [Sphingorhabdus sp.]MBH9536873.1 biopolymer transporter ExbD [Novosphingopyxis sp. YJ-S2-01]|tara:strand:- start:1477 stop:1923 length:447 start_codon:yes stop_codon:yes gene_type:complete